MTGMGSIWLDAAHDVITPSMRAPWKNIAKNSSIAGDKAQQKGMAITLVNHFQDFLSWLHMYQQYNSK
jgi:hypothetical protein